MNRGFRNDSSPDDQGNNEPRSPLGRWSVLVWLLLLMIALPFVWQLLGRGQTAPQIEYSTFRRMVQEGNVERITVTGEEISGELNEAASTTLPTGESVNYTEFVTYVPSFGDEELMPLLREYDVEINTQPENTFNWWIVLLNGLPFLLLLGVGWFFLRRMGSQNEGVFSMGKSRAKQYDRKKERTTFSDVAGAQGAKRELEEIIEYLRSPQRFQRLGGEIPRGVLLVGPPGTGKTLLARAVAGEAGAPFFSITGSDFMEMFVGVGASRVRDLFKEAKQTSPSIIFIDELDSIGRRRGAGVGGGHDEREQTLNQLLSEMDGFERNESVIIMAATNRPDILDPALLRPGRFDRQITVDLPTLNDRLEILKIHARNKPLAEDVDLERLARGTPGFSGADLENLLNEAALIAARYDKDAIHKEDIEEARDKVIMGLERESLVLGQDVLRTLAYHEAGHAVVAAALPHADPIHKVTIVPRGRAMGVTQQIPERDRYLYDRDYMLDRMAVMMGGRAAEELVLNMMTSGASNDLKQATHLARTMVLEWGMSRALGPVALGDDNDQVFLGEELTSRRHYSEDTARKVDEEVRQLLEEAFTRATDTLEENREGLDRLVEALIEYEVVSGERVLELLGMEEKKAALGIEPQEGASSEAGETAGEGETSAGEDTGPLPRKKTQPATTD